MCGNKEIQWPRVIAHVDADAFFASVEQALHPKFKGKPVITGAERGLVIAASYEAKAQGVKRGMVLSEVTRICPECILLTGDYESYSIFSKRMFEIMRRFTPDVEEYSIDEAFLDLTGTRRLHHRGYLEIGRAIQQEIQKELGIGVSIGISLSKSTAKLCSKIKKPLGLLQVNGNQLHLLLGNTPLEKVWGFGPSSCAKLKKYGLKTALDFVHRPMEFADRLLGKIGRELWLELKGSYIYNVNPNAKHTQLSISKFKTFTPAVSDKGVLYSRALRNLENACIKARRLGQRAKGLSLFLRGQDFSTTGLEAKLSRPSSTPMEITGKLNELFEASYRPGRFYRATGIALSALTETNSIQFDMFEEPSSVINKQRAFEAVDKIGERFGKHTVFLADGTKIPSQHEGTNRQHIRMPLLY